jgi:hypothetical protein
MPEWPGAQDGAQEQEQDNAELYKRLLAAYSIPAEDRATWLTDMADLYDGEPYAVVEAAVDRYTRDVKPGPKEFVRVPAPAAFSDWVLAAQQAAERARQRAVPALPSPAQEAVLTEREVKQVRWIRRWYAGALAERKAAEYLNERTSPEDMAWFRMVWASEDRLGHIPDLPPERLKAALADFKGKVEDDDTGERE